MTDKTKTHPGQWLIASGIILLFMTLVVPVMTGSSEEGMSGGALLIGLLGAGLLVGGLVVRSLRR